MLIVFFETPKPKREGRWPYIAAIFIIFTLSAIPVCMDAALIFFDLFKSESPADIITINPNTFQYEWMRVYGEIIPNYLLIFVCDGLMVS